MASFCSPSPETIYINDMAQMFKHDPQVHVVYDAENRELRLYVDSGIKAQALEALLPNDIKWGNFILNILVITAHGEVKTNHLNTTNLPYLLELALEGNGALSFIKTVKGIFKNDLVYVVFKNEVVQYYSDYIGDIYGQTSTLYQEIANNIFGPIEGVFFCTDVPQSTTSIEWP